MLKKRVMERLMDETAIEGAARLLLAVREGRIAPPEGLPPGAAPKTPADGHAVQDRILAITGEPVAAMKVVANDEGVLRGAIPASLVLASPATMLAAFSPRRGLEAEIAFRLDRTLPQREAPYSRDEVASAVTALVAIEAVETRFSRLDAPLLDRLADSLSNGALVTGTVRPDWRDFDLPALEVAVSVAGREVKRCKGGYTVAAHPLDPALALINAITTSAPVPASFIITTGTYSGLDFHEPGDTVKVEFIGFGEAELTFE